MKVDIFGKKRLADFYQDPDYININHGSYGYCPRVVIAAKRKLQEQVEFNTQSWFRWDSGELMIKAREVAAKRVNAPLNNIFLVQNSTDAINSLLKSLKWKAGDTIAIANTAYACVRKTVQWLRDYYQIKILDINFTLQDYQNVYKLQIKIQDTINAYPSRVSLAIIDHISSVPGVVLPIQSISQFFKQKGIPLFVDGAHALGQVQINFKQLEVDAYFSNFHKWSFAPKSAAFLYISNKYLDIVRPVITGNFRGEGPQRQFYWTGTRDYTSYFVIDKAFQYYDSFGWNRVKQYNRNLSIDAANKMAEIWKTRKFTQDIHLMSMLNNVEVPSTDIDLCQRIAKRMLDEYNCYPALFKFQGKVYCRISAQIFNELSDYVYAANIFLALLKEETQQKK